MPGKGTKRTLSAPGLPSHRGLFSSVAAKKKPREAFSLFSPGIPEAVIFSFLGVSDKMKFFELNEELKKKLGANSSLKQALIKDLLLTLVTAFQKPRSPYTPEQAENLLNGTLKLTATDHPVEYQLAVMLADPKYREERGNDFYQAFKIAHKQALAKTVLLALTRAHQFEEAQVLLHTFPPFLNNIEDQLDYLLALMVSGNQIAAEDWIKRYPDVLRQKGRVIDLDGKIYEGITPYQYTLCLKYTQMRLMIRRYLSPQEAALQAREYESGQNREMQTLKLKYEELRNKTHQAYRFYLENRYLWNESQIIDYWVRVVGGLQRKWPVHWMQEVFYQGAFNGATNFKSERAMKALPRAIYNCEKPFYPWNQGYVGMSLKLKCYTKEERIATHELLWTPCLIKQEEDYFVYRPGPTGNLEAAVNRELIKLDLACFAETLQQFSFSETMCVMELEYKPAFRPLFDAIDKALGGNVIGDGFSFTFAVANNQINRHMRETMPFPWMIRDNLAGLECLDKARSEELSEELEAVKQLLINSEAEAGARNSLASFR